MHVLCKEETVLLLWPEAMRRVKERQNVLVKPIAWTPKQHLVTWEGRCSLVLCMCAREAYDRGALADEFGRLVHSMLNILI